MVTEAIVSALGVIGLNGLVLKLQDNKIKDKVSKDEFKGFRELFEERTGHIAGALARIEDRIDFIAQQNGYKK